MSAVTSVLLHSRLGCHGIFRPTFGTCHRFIPGFPLNFESSNSGLSLNRLISVDLYMIEIWLMENLRDRV